KWIDGQQQSPLISDTKWREAKLALFKKYKDSSCLENIKTLLRDFEVTHKNKYRSDFIAFLDESRYEDFYDDESEVIFVSTIHKAKGREFDHVYLMLKDNEAIRDEVRRCIYVAMTRAKQALYIHTNTAAFDRVGMPSTLDTRQYEQPKAIILQSGYKDVVLDYFKDKKELLFGIQSGDTLHVDGGYLSTRLNNRDIRVVKLSKQCLENLGRLAEKGYTLSTAEVRFIVAWKGEQDVHETPVLLLNLHLEQS
ncbi:MAG: 3'-5' exonuclease, partial [Erysipelotrichaceae bacterium]